MKRRVIGAWLVIGLAIDMGLLYLVLVAGWDPLGA